MRVLATLTTVIIFLATSVVSQATAEQNLDPGSVLKRYIEAQNAETWTPPLLSGPKMV